MTDEDFDEICATFKIDRDKRDDMRRRFDEIVHEYATKIRGERLRLDRQADQDWLRDALTATQRARAALPSRPGEAAEVPLKVAGALLGPVVSASWLGEKFPGFGNLLLAQNSDRGSPEWKPWRPPADDPSAMARAEFIGRETVPVLSALLAEVELVLKIADGMLPLLPGGKGGRRRLMHRRYMIANLAKCWRSLGRRPTSGPNSSFTAFCEAVFESIGWPTDGLQAAVPDALTLLRHHPERITG